MSLYAKINFNDPAKSEDINKGSIEREPITYTNQQTETKKSTITQEIDEHRRMTSAALQFQPIRRPPQTKKNTKKTPSTYVQPHIVLQNVSSLDYWSHKDEDINENYDNIEARKTAKNRKKKKKTKDMEVETISWDDPYDPLKPNDYEEYKMSDEAVQEMIDWKNKQEKKIDIKDSEKYKNMGQFAPPTSYSPQPFTTNSFSENVASTNSIPSMLLDETAEEAYARRVAMSQNRNIEINYQLKQSTEPSYENNIPVSSSPPSVEPLPSRNTGLVDETTNQSSNTLDDKRQTSTDNVTIIREPQMYGIKTDNTEEFISTENNYQDQNVSESLEIQNNSNMPGQKKFAERLMKKYGWEKGKGLGASNDGIINPLIVKQSKDRKGTGSIINKNPSEKVGKFGKMSKVVLLTNVSELETLDDDLSQEIGDECNKSYGKVERCFVYKNTNSSLTTDIVRVFVLFTDTISALRAVNALNGRLFGGKKINARFYDIDKFENGQYDA
ncbi:hypothetical protein PORY_002501 [Pneumocystis oryctolagi]|uniref:Uncharacterized protein n=1 Tax=Pneumocystis oryctolagi TaxID=42067 RepID=A0ACB7CCB9_9ASCO|nr:hypothetical protein PORY_002501 [Pneumocystis oryctolagi]